MLLEKVQNTIERENLLNKDERIVIGVSGGPDSMALLHILHRLEYQCIVVHCNFHLRGSESDRDESFVHDYCRKNGFKIYVESFNTIEYSASHKISIEMAARDLRYNLFQKILCKEHIKSIAVAHHQDDNVETVLLNLVRGTGIRGLCGMKYKNDKNVIRPLLDISRHEIMKYLESNNIPYVIDRTNLEADVKRNFIRLKVLPLLHNLNPSVGNAISRTCNHLRQVSEIYSDAIRNALGSILHKSSLGYFFITISDLKGFISPQSLLFEWLSPYKFNETQINDISLSLDKNGQKYIASTGYVVYIGRDALVLDLQRIPNKNIRIEREGIYEVTDGQRIKVECKKRDAQTDLLLKKKAFAFLDREKINFPLTIRFIQEKDSFRPYGMKGTQLISDYLTNIKMPQFMRRHQLIVEKDNTIVWLVKQRIAQPYSVDCNTKDLIILSVLDS